eukprot:10981864-Heterocapsa_arctica.AAC.1
MALSRGRERYFYINDALVQARTQIPCVGTPRKLKMALSCRRKRYCYTNGALVQARTPFA